MLFDFIFHDRRQSLRRRFCLCPCEGRDYPHYRIERKGGVAQIAGGGLSATSISLSLVSRLTSGLWARLITLYGLKKDLGFLISLLLWLIELPASLAWSSCYEA